VRCPPQNVIRYLLLYDPGKEPSLANTNDLQLGTLDFDGTAWVRPVAVPAFEAYSYGDPPADAPAGHVKLAFLVPRFGPSRNSDPPAPDTVKVAVDLLANQASLAGSVASALWEEFNDRGPVSGLWWRGKLADVQAAAADEGLGDVRGPGDVRRLLRLVGIAIAPFGFGGDEPAAQLHFRAAFESEHGVAVLTDGIAVLGTGYLSDGAEPYE
jgi:hypothetical protein